MDEDDQQFEDEQRDNDQDPAGDGDPNPALQGGDLRIGRAPEAQAAENRADPSEEIGHAGQVGDDVIAVEADDRKQLMGDLHVLDDDQQQQRLDVAGRGVDTGGDQDDHHVEVDASQISAQAAAAAQAIGVADVGVEGRPGQVEAAAHAARAGAAVAAGAGMADLVKCGRHDDGAQQRQEEAGMVQRLAQRLGDAELEEDPPIRDHQAGSRITSTTGKKSGLNVAPTAPETRSDTTPMRYRKARNGSDRGSEGLVPSTAATRC